MKKSYLFAALLLSGNTLFAQSFSRTDVGYTPGDNFTMYTSNYVNPGNAGTGVTWNFSTMTNNSQVTVATAVNSTGSFLNANVKLTQSDGVEIFCSISNSDMEVLAVNAGGAAFTYTNPLTYMKFPITTSYNYTDAFAADVIASGINVNRIGTVQSEYSGAGTLITPAGTFTNVIRIKSTQTITDTVPGMGNHSTIVAYNWYKAGVNHELANVTEVTSSSSSQSAYYTSVPLNLGLEENELINLLVFPNPATNRIHINSDEVISKVEVYQLSGELALEQTANATALEIDLTALNTGMYLVKVTGQNGAVSVKRITKN